MDGSRPPTPEETQADLESFFAQNLAALNEAPRKPPTTQHIEAAISRWTPYLLQLSMTGFAGRGERGAVVIWCGMIADKALIIAGSSYFVPSDHPAWTQSLREGGMFPDEALRRYNPASEAVIVLSFGDVSWTRTIHDRTRRQ